MRNSGGAAACRRGSGARSSGGSWLAWLAVAGCLASAGCTQFEIRNHVAVPRHESRWWWVKTPHFEVITDLDRDDGVAVAAELERSYRMLVDFTDFLFTGRQAPSLSTLVVQLRSRTEFEELTGRENYNGMFFAHGPADKPTLLAFGELDRQARRTLLHETTHRILEHHVPGAPAWLHEGLARYFESLRVEDGTARLGEVPPSVVAGPRGIPVHALPPVKRLITASHGAFHPDPEANDSARLVEAVNYAGAWCLVHLLNNGTEGYRPRFLRLLATMAGGTSFAEAWQRGFFNVPLDTLDEQYRQHFTMSESYVYLTPYQLPDVPAPEVSEATLLTASAVLTVIYQKTESRSRRLRN